MADKMVDNRSAGIINGIAGGINFRSGDISGTAAKTADDRSTPGMEYFLREGEEQSPKDTNFIDRSMELRASLNSLALLNVVSILRNNRNKSVILDDDEDLLERIGRVKKIEKNKEEDNKKDN